MKTSKFFIVLILVSVSNIAFAAGRVTLIIEPPLRDGGERLMIYHVECQEVGTEHWREVGAPLVPMVDKGNGRFEYVNTPCRVDNLEEGKSYIFRVRVENDYGVGQPGPESEEILVTNEDQSGIKIQSGPGLERVRGMNTSSLATTPSVQEARGMTFLWRKEE